MPIHHVVPIAGNDHSTVGMLAVGLLLDLVDGIVEALGCERRTRNTVEADAVDVFADDKSAVVTYEQLLVLRAVAVDRTRDC